MPEGESAALRSTPVPVPHAPVCPRCGGSMSVKTAKRGAYEGQPFWACDRFPKCWGKLAISNAEQTHASPMPVPRHAALPPRPLDVTRPVDAPTRSDAAAGASAQARFDREQERQRRRIRMAWPALATAGVLMMVIAFFALLPFAGLAFASAIAVLVGVGFALALDRLPADAQAWRRGAQGERSTASYLTDLELAGFVVLHDRRMPGSRGNIDSIAIGPSGVWIIETKRLSGRVEILNERLWVRDQVRDNLVEQVYRQAVEVQIALGGASVGAPTVRPVLCIHRAKLPREQDVRGVMVVNGRRLPQALQNAPTVLDADAVQAIAREADRILRPMRQV